MYAARAVFAALKAGDVSAAALARLRPHGGRAATSCDDMRRTRNMRLAFKDGFFVGGAQGRADDAHRRALSRREDRHGRGRRGRRARVTPRTPFTPDGTLTFSKVDAVFKSGNATRDDDPVAT